MVYSRRLGGVAQGSGTLRMTQNAYGEETPYKRELWYLGPNTIAPVAKNRPNTIRSLSDGGWLNLKKFLETLYSNIIDLNKNYKFISLFSNLVSVKKIFIDFKLRTFYVISVIRGVLLFSYLSPRSLYGDLRYATGRVIVGSD